MSEITEAETSDIFGVEDDGLCGDCMDGKCHGTDPGDCGCARHAASVEARESFDPNDDGHCGNDCGGTCSNDGTGEWYEPEKCVCCECCCTCTPCEYARVA